MTHSYSMPCVAFSQRRFTASGCRRGSLRPNPSVHFADLPPEGRSPSRCQKSLSGADGQGRRRRPPHPSPPPPRGEGIGGPVGKKSGSENAPAVPHDDIGSRSRARRRARRTRHRDPTSRTTRMATQAQVDANRRNSKKSTGLKSRPSKNKTRFNGLKHGLRRARRSPRRGASPSSRPSARPGSPTESPGASPAPSSWSAPRRPRGERGSPFASRPPRPPGWHRHEDVADELHCGGRRGRDGPGAFVATDRRGRRGTTAALAARGGSMTTSSGHVGVRPTFSGWAGQLVVRAAQPQEVRRPGPAHASCRPATRTTSLSGPSSAPGWH
jgi:hypothetical protein